MEPAAGIATARLAGPAAAARGEPSLQTPPFCFVQIVPGDDGRLLGCAQAERGLRAFILSQPDHVEISEEQHALLKHSSESYRLVAGELVVIPPPPPTLEELEKRGRAERDRRLAASDWMVQPDVPASDEKRAARLAYRQALRDITDQPGWPAMVQWPTAP